MDRQTIQFLSNNNNFSYIITTETKAEIIKKYYSKEKNTNNITEIIIKYSKPLEA